MFLVLSCEMRGLVLRNFRRDLAFRRILSRLTTLRDANEKWSSKDYPRDDNILWH